MLPKRTVEQFAEDYERTNLIIRPNPDWEEDLRQTVVVTPEIEARVRSYSQFKSKKPRPECFCMEPPTSPGVAPRITLNDGKTIPCFGLGTSLSVAGDRVPVEEGDDSMQKAVEYAIDAGYRHIDTAVYYNTEEQVGKAIKNKIEEGVVSREDLFITTKLWNDSHAQRDVVPALRESLKRLGLTYVNLYLIHWPVAQYDDGTYYDTDYLETWQGMIDAQLFGLAKSIGVCNFNITQIDRLICMTKVKPAVLQTEVNLNLQQADLLEFCKWHNIAVVAHSPFGNIFHSTAAEGAPPPRTDEQALLRIAERHHKTVAQINLRYLVELGVIPIPKTVTKRRIEANIEVFDFCLNQKERDVLKSYERNYRTIAKVKEFQDSPYYPFKNYVHVYYDPPPDYTLD